MVLGVICVTCGVLRCPNFNFHAASSKELKIHINKKHSSCQSDVVQGDGKHAQQPSNTNREKLKMKNIYIQNIVNTGNITKILA